MLTLQRVNDVKLIVAFILADNIAYEKTKKIFSKKFGKIDYESDPIPFDFTSYYAPEMGNNLIRRFISFEKLIKPEKLLDIKLFSIRIEKKFATNNKRIINIDPGYINEAKFILSTTKDFSHRIYIGKGIFEEITLNYQNKKFQDLPTTFPDYRSEKYKSILTLIRNKYRLQLNKI